MNSDLLSWGRLYMDDPNSFLNECLDKIGIKVGSSYCYSPDFCGGVVTIKSAEILPLEKCLSNIRKYEADTPFWLASCCLRVTYSTIYVSRPTREYQSDELKLVEYEADTDHDFNDWDCLQDLKELTPDKYKEYTKVINTIRDLFVRLNDSIDQCTLILK